MRRTWTIIGVRDVARSFEWYQSLFGQPFTHPAHDDFGQLCDSDGTVLLCLHQWGAHEHPPLLSPENGKPGNGLLLFFRVDDFSMALKRARALVTRLVCTSCCLTNGSSRCARFAGVGLNLFVGLSARIISGRIVAISDLRDNQRASIVRLRDRGIAH